MIIATANLIKEAREMKRHADGLLGVGEYEMRLAGDYAEIKGDHDCLFPGFNGVLVEKIGSKFLTIIAQGETVSRVLIGECVINFVI